MKLHTVNGLGNYSLTDYFGSVCFCAKFNFGYAGSVGKHHIVAYPVDMTKTGEGSQILSLINISIIFSRQFRICRPC